MPLLGQAIQFDGEVQGFRLGDRERLQLRPCKFISFIPPGSTNSCAFGSNMITTLREEHLLHPKARRGAVEQTKKGKMIVLGGVAGQLDDRGCLLKHLPAVVEHEVVVCGDEREGDGQRGAKLVNRQVPVLIPC